MVVPALPLLVRTTLRMHHESWGDLWNPILLVESFLCWFNISTFLSCFFVVYTLIEQYVSTLVTKRILHNQVEYLLYYYLDNYLM